jgi:hypothetical protein
VAEGYTYGKPNTSWWLEQINAGIEYRKKYAHEGSWGRWRQYYRGQWKTGVLPVNVFFSMLRQVVPRVYFRNPAVSVTPAMPGFLNMAFARLLHRIDNKMIDQMGIKHEIKDMIPDAFLKGTGIGKLGFGAEFSPTPTGDSSAPEGSKGERYEYNSRVMDGMPWFARCCPGTIIVPDGVRRLHEARWIGHWIKRPKSDVESDPRLRGARDLPATSKAAGPESNYSVRKLVDMVDLVEIRDRKYSRVFVMAPYGHEGTVLYSGPDKLQDRRLPFFAITFNPDDEVFWGVPDAQILEPAQLERNEIRTQAMKHRRVALVKILYEKGVLSPEQAAQMVSEDVGAAIEIDGDLARIEKMQISNIPQDLVIHEGQVEHDSREVMGFGRNQMGEYQTRRGDTSATEAAAVEAGSDIRVDERRDVVADMLVEVIQEMNEVLFDEWSVEQVVDVVGPGGVPIWVRVDPALLRAGRYVVKVDPDSATQRTRQQREAKSVGIYNLLKTNPFIDPMKLTHYILHEMEGVELDDLLRAMPPVENGAQQGVLNPGQFADMLQQGMGELARNPGAIPGLPMG